MIQIIKLKPQKEKRFEGLINQNPLNQRIDTTMETRKGNKDKKSSTKHYTENKTLRNTNLTKKQR